jgi:hypothetical protein
MLGSRGGAGALQPHWASLDERQQVAWPEIDHAAARGVAAQNSVPHAIGISHIGDEFQG